MESDELLDALRLLPGNMKCADCGEDEPTWASLSYGTLHCLECCGEHRGLGVGVSFIRSLHLDSWSVRQNEVMLRGGNAKWHAHISRHGIARDAPIPQKYDSFAGSEYRAAITSQAKSRSCLSPRSARLSSASTTPTTRSSPRSSGAGTKTLSPRRRSRRCSKIELAPVYGLRRAVAPLSTIVPGVLELCAAACSFATNKLMLENDPYGLSVDEVAAINLITLNSPFRHTLNAMLRSCDNDDVEPFFPYLRLVLSALLKLPAYRGSTYVFEEDRDAVVRSRFGDDRGGAMGGGATASSPRGDDRGVSYPEGTAFFWPHIAHGRTALLFSAEQMVRRSAKTRGRGAATMFCVESESGRDVREYSTLRESEEVILLLPGTELKVHRTLGAAPLAFSEVSMVSVRETSTNGVALFRLAEPKPLLSASSLIDAEQVEDQLGASWPPRHRQIRLDSQSGIATPRSTPHRSGGGGGGGNFSAGDDEALGKALGMLKRQSSGSFGLW